jgi:hypothetical protein
VNPIRRSLEVLSSWLAVQLKQGRPPFVAFCKKSSVLSQELSLNIWRCADQALSFWLFTIEHLTVRFIPQNHRIIFCNKIEE